MVEENSTNKILAMKVILKEKLIEEGQISSAKLEKEIMQNAYHPFIIELEYCFQNEESIYFLAKFMYGGDLVGHLNHEKRFSDDRAKFYSSQVALAIGHLHKNNIIYRDIKPSNILIDSSGYISVTDFGIAKFIEDDRKALTFCGTPEYLG